MRGLRLLFNFVKLYAGVGLLASSLLLPIIGVVLIFSPRNAIILVGVISLVACTLLLLLPEWGILRLLRGQLPRTHGLRNSYEMAYAASGKVLKTRPTLVTFADPVPNMYVIRSLGGHGMILLSDGFISILDESELRFVLVRAIQHLLTGEVVLQSACLVALTLIRTQLDIRAIELEPMTALKELLLFPWFRFFSELALTGTKVTRRVGRNGPPSLSLGENFIRGASKLSRAERLYGQEAALPGLVYLSIER